MNFTKKSQSPKPEICFHTKPRITLLNRSQFTALSGKLVYICFVGYIQNCIKSDVPYILQTNLVIQSHKAKNQNMIRHLDRPQVSLDHKISSALIWG